MKRTIISIHVKLAHISKEEWMYNSSIDPLNGGCEYCNNVGYFECSTCDGTNELECDICDGYGEYDCPHLDDDNPEDFQCDKCNRFDKVKCDNCVNGVIECDCCEDGTSECSECWGRPFKYNYDDRVNDDKEAVLRHVNGQFAYSPHLVGDWND